MSCHGSFSCVEFFSPKWIFPHCGFSIRVCGPHPLFTPTLSVVCYLYTYVLACNHVVSACVCVCVCVIFFWGGGGVGAITGRVMQYVTRQHIWHYRIRP